MALTLENKFKIFQKASLSRAFEEEVFRRVSNKDIQIPVYLSAGQEFISATLAVFFEHTANFEDKFLYSIEVTPHI